MLWLENHGNYDFAKLVFSEKFIMLQNEQLHCNNHACLFGALFELTLSSFSDTSVRIE